MSRLYILSAMMLCFSLLISPLASNAQTLPKFTGEQQELLNSLPKEERDRLIELGPPSAVGFGNNQVTGLDDTVNCFDYYSFGSVQVDVSPTIDQTVPGMPLTFVGKIRNNNPYPIVNGSVYVKIFKLEDIDGVDTHQNGYPLVAFFEAGEDIVIPANTEKDFTFDWQVPSFLQGGEYQANFFFVTDHRFNLLGLTFTDDVTGNKANFSVTNATNKQVVFDKNSVTLNDKPYLFATFPPHLDLDTPALLKAELVNPSDVEKVVTLSWRLYNWDGLRDDSQFDSKKETIVLKPYEKREVTYSTSKQIGSVSYIIATVQDGDAASIINPRFVRDGIEEVRLNFPSLYTYPLEIGKEATFFSCAHSTNLPLVEGNTLTLTLADADTNKTFHSYTYEGGITGSMMAVKDSFIPSHVPQRVVLTTTLTRNGEIVDTVSQIYDCANLSSGECPKSGQDAANTATNIPTKNIIIAIIVGVLTLSAITALIIMYHRRNIHITFTTPSDTTL